MINGIKCFIKYHFQPSKKECNVWVYSKIYSKELEYTFKDVRQNFNVKAAIRKLKIVYADTRNPYLAVNNTFQDTFVDIQSDTLYFMLPKQMISYIYGCADNGLHLVTYAIKKQPNSNKLEIKILEPLMFSSENKEQFCKVIDPVHLFKYLRTMNIEAQDYEMGLNPFRYRSIITTSVLKQYLRENLFIGELEVEPHLNKKTNRRFSTENNSATLSKQQQNPTIVALIDNQGKNMKRKSVQITNFFKNMTANVQSDLTSNNASVSSKKHSKESLILSMFKISKQKATEYLLSKRSAQETRLEDSQETFMVTEPSQNLLLQKPS